MNQDITKLISLKPYRNYWATAFAIIILFSILFLYYIFIRGVINNDLNKIIELYGIVPSILSIALLIALIWSYRIAKQTGREPSVWIFIGIFLGPIGLLILSLKDYKINNLDLAEIVRKTRIEYKNELKESHNLNNGLAQDLELKYSKILFDRTSQIITKEKLKVLKDFIDDGVIDDKIDVKEKERLINLIEKNKLIDSELENWSPEWAENEMICPACGYPVQDGSNICLGCGLRLK